MQDFSTPLEQFIELSNPQRCHYHCSPPQTTISQWREITGEGMTRVQHLELLPAQGVEELTRVHVRKYKACYKCTNPCRTKTLATESQSDRVRDAHVSTVLKYELSSRSSSFTLLSTKTRTPFSSCSHLHRPQLRTNVRRWRKFINIQDNYIKILSELREYSISTSQREYILI